MHKKNYYLSLFFSLTVCCFLLSGCQFHSANNEDVGHVVIDSIGREVIVPSKVEKIVVFNAYNAELLNAIGAIDKVVGVDDYIYQDKAGFQNRFSADMNVGKGTEQVDYERIIALNPEMVIATGNAITAEKMERKLSPFGIKVVVVNAYYTDQFAKNVDLLGLICNKEAEAENLKNYFLSKLQYIQKQLQDAPKRRLYFEYRKKGLTTARGDYFYWMVEYSGADNIFKNIEGREIDPEQVISLNPEYIVKVSDPISRSSYIPPTFEQVSKIKLELVSRPGWDNIEAVSSDRILLLSHYVHGGASKLVGTMYIAKFLYPEYLPDLHPEEVFATWLEKYQGLPYIEGHSMPMYKRMEHINGNQNIKSTI